MIRGVGATGIAGTTEVASAKAEFTAFVEERGDRLLEVAWLITRHREDALDAVQDALAGLYGRWSRLPSGDEFDAYVHRTVVNACLGVIRRRPRSLPVAEPDRLRTVPVAADPTAAVDDADEVWRLCGELGPVQRTAVVLRFYGDLSYAEIGRALGCREATARSHVHRATALLRTRTEGRR
nr:sigma-70 family RNA polymerase sigma factor [Propionicimonas sp.]